MTPYNALVRGEPKNVALGMLLVLLAIAFYPALMLGRRLAPEASLRSASPWRLEWGPTPDPSPRVLAAATELGPRLAVIGREGVAAAIWNPWIGGGRAGWLSSPREGGAPLPVLAALLARPGWAWTALVALTVAASFTTAWLAARWTGASGWAAAAAATAYSLAGPVAWHWLDWRGSAVALGPLALLPSLARWSGWGRRTAAWSAAVALVALAGPPAVPFIALAFAHELAGKGRRMAVRGWSAIAAALLLVTLARLPVTWLHQAGAEPGARAQAARVAPPLNGPTSLFSRGEAGRLAARQGGATPAAADAVGDPGFLGVTTLLLAALGFATSRPPDRRFWGAITCMAFALSLVPSSWLAEIGLSQRPLAVLALAVALLAAGGVDSLIRRLRPEWAPAIGAAICLAVVVELAPVALHELPFATVRDAQLPAPVPAALTEDGSRVVAMMSALPPDIAASFGVADVRARWFDREPAFEQLVGGRHAGTTQVLDPTYGMLGARWVLEPVPLRVVSGLVFGDIDVVEAPRISPEEASTARFRLTVPETACRLGLPSAETGENAVFLQSEDATVVLEEDRALAEESLEWRWVGVKPRAPRGEVVLGVIGSRKAPASLSVAIDVSGVRLAAEDQGLRVWERERAARFARLDTAEPGAFAAVEALSEDRAEISVRAPRTSTLIVQIKHRPGLWRASVNGRPVSVAVAQGVWTAVPVPAGDSRVVLRAAIPAAVWVLSAAAVIMAALLAAYRRSS